jgi:hypothetical protein
VPTAPVVGLVGLAALRRDIAKMTDETRGTLYEAIKSAGRELAEPVAARTVSTLPTSGLDGTQWHRPGALKGSVRVYATRSGAGVRMGSKAIPYAGWVEFGGSRPDGSERTFFSDGRYMFNAARSMQMAAAEKYSAALQRALERTGLWTNEGTDPGGVHD